MRRRVATAASAPARSPPSRNLRRREFRRQRVRSTSFVAQLTPSFGHILRMKKYELYLPLEPQALDLALRSALQRLCQGIPELLERVKVGRPVRIRH